MRTETPAPATRAPQPTRGPASPNTILPRPTVLVVEDEPAIRILLCELLEAAGLDVEDAEDADSALELLSALGDDRTRCGVMVTDVNLGKGLDGVALAAVACRRVPGLQVLYVTASPERVPGRGAAPWPRGRVLGKPFANAELVAAVRELATSAAVRG